MADDQTLFALASGPPPCAIAIMRVSGPVASQIASLLGARPVPPRRASLRRLHDPRDGSLIDEALLLYFPAPASATGDDVLEIQCHGSRAIVRALEDALASLPGLVKAGPGDFTRRAFANGRINLAQVEALGDLLAAETDRQRRAALSLWEGGLTGALEQTRSGLLAAAARLELALDFADEEDHASATALTDEARAELAACRATLADLSRRADGRRLREGIRVVLGGSPNAGKSTLFNALVGRDAAIVSAEAGTTRDVVEAVVERGGLPFILSDTAGLRDVPWESVEGQGIARAQALIDRADILLWLEETPPPVGESVRVIHVLPKADADPPAGPGRIAVSARDGWGIDHLWQAILTAAAPLVPALGDFGLNERQFALIGEALSALAEALAVRDELIMAEQLRLALFALDQLIGRASTEAMLDTLFAGFCIGK